jgi:hypothetical protein
MRSLKFVQTLLGIHLAVGQHSSNASFLRLEIIERSSTMSIFTILFVILLFAWIMGWGVFHVAGGLIHILLIVALISLVLHFIRGPRAV